MVKEIRYTTIHRVLDNLLDHPMLSDVSLEQAVRYALRFQQLNGFPKLYEDKIDQVEIEHFRGLLPCDLISIIQVKDCETGICLRAMTDNFTPGLVTPPTPPPSRPKDLLNNVRDELKEKDLYIPPKRMHIEEPAFKTQGRIIYTSFPDGIVEVAYKAIPVDDDGFPMLIDNENYLAALEAFIKVRVFTNKFDQGKISVGVLQNAQQDYAWAAGTLDAEFTVPSVSEMEAYSRMYQTLIPKMREFDNGFRNMSDREYIRKH